MSVLSLTMVLGEMVGLSRVFCNQSKHFSFTLELVLEWQTSIVVQVLWGPKFDSCV